jgi:hypothetical protein
MAELVPPCILGGVQETTEVHESIQAANWPPGLIHILNMSNASCDGLSAISSSG